MKRNDVTKLLCLFCIFAIVHGAQTAANAPPQKFFPINRAQSQPKKPQAETKFIPLKRPGGRPLVFVPKSRQPLKLDTRPAEPAPSGDVKNTQPFTDAQANGLLSIYESVE